MAALKRYVVLEMSTFVGSKMHVQHSLLAELQKEGLWSNGGNL